MRTYGTKMAGLVLMMLLSATPAAAQQLPFTWDVPKLVDVVDVPGVMMADGVPVRIRAVRSQEKPEALLQHLVDRFEGWGFYIPPMAHQPQIFREPQLTALDPERLISYTVIFQPNPDGTTTLLLGEAHLSQPASKPSGIAPVFPGARDVLHSDVEVARSLTYSASAEVPEVEAFYRQELRERGYTEVEPYLYRSGSDELQVIVRPARGEQVSVVVLRRTASTDE